MKKHAVKTGRKIPVTATHGPTVENTRALLRESTAKLEVSVTFSGVTGHATDDSPMSIAHRTVWNMLYL